MTESPPSAAAKPKYILLWNEAYGNTKYEFCCGLNPFKEMGCKYQNCYTTDDRHYLPHNEFDAILFHQRSIEAKDLPSNRVSSQRYIMWMMESASYPFGFRSSDWNGFFNWTKTYRNDSDFSSVYGHVFQTKPLPVSDSNLPSHIKSFGIQNKHLVGKKNSSVAWFVSNCNSASGREIYVEELKKHIDVDIYGGCGKFQCPRSNETACWEMADEKYFFYLSFENSICLDYVTEKFFNAMKYNIIPVVFGGTDYEKSAGAPPHSHINAYKDFKNPAELAKYMKSLMENPDKYAEYFWWKGYFKSDSSHGVRAGLGFCDLCEKLHTDHGTKIYKDLDEWWIKKSKCEQFSLQ